MTFDMNDVAPQQTGDLIPDGTFAKVTMSIRKGGVDGMSAVDRGLLESSNQPGSDVRMVDAEFTVAEGPFARRKFWQNFTVQGGKLDEQGQSVGWKISKSQFRAMIDSALGLNPEDMSDAAKAKRVLRGLADLDGITFVAKIQVEPNRNPAYKDANKLDHVVLPTAPEWQKVMAGEQVPAQPSNRPRPAAAAAGSAAPAWVQSQPASSAFTLQIGDANTLAMLTGITTISDFRRRDIAEGGQGAPLAPAFHKAVFASPTSDRAIVNIGGMANITLLPAKGQCSGFDTGPGNVLMDTWIHQQKALAFDDGGRWAASGKIDKALLQQLLALPYFQHESGPRSTGREDFDAALLSNIPGNIRGEDVQATLLEFTAQTIAAPLLRLDSRPSQLYACGGGAYNTVLIQRLETLLHPMIVTSTQQLGIAPEWVEAMAFAWLEHRRLEGKSGNIPSVTGAARDALLGDVFAQLSYANTLGPIKVRGWTGARETGWTGSASDEDDGVDRFAAKP